MGLEETKPLPQGYKRVFQDALLKRLNRKLKHKNLKIRSPRDGNRYKAVLGLFYLVNLETGNVVQGHIDLETCARTYGVLGEKDVYPPYRNVDTDS